MLESLSDQNNKNLEILKAAWIEWYVASSSEIETVL